MIALAVIVLLFAPAVVSFGRDLPGAWRGDGGLPRWIGRAAVLAGIGIPFALGVAAWLA